ncbi:MAG TPA: hypothetical protein VFW89_06400 [Gemmatimonadaceae bacterium]|nr:hypothetical protein [Gemmatimonadaceae bacterium]
MAGRVMGPPLKRQELMDGRDRDRVRTVKAHLRPARAVDRFILNHVAPRGHDCGPRDDLRVHLERLAEVSGLKRRGDAPHVPPNRRNSGRVSRVSAIQHDAAPIREVLEDMRRRVLVHAHHRLATRLCGSESRVCVAPTLLMRACAAAQREQAQGKQERDTAAVPCQQAIPPFVASGVNEVAGVGGGACVGDARHNENAFDSMDDWDMVQRLF